MRLVSFGAVDLPEANASDDMPVQIRSAFIPLPYGGYDQDGAYAVTDAVSVRRRVMVYVGDGADTVRGVEPSQWSAALVERFREAGVSFSWVAIDKHDTGRRMLDDLAIETGVELLMYDVVCFWDVLEHTLDFVTIVPILALAKYVAITLPLMPMQEKLSTWKHFKPGEHLHYYTADTLDALFAKYGFELRKAGQPECPPRKDITSVLYAKIDFASRT